MPMIIVLTTISTGGQAEVLAEKIVASNLAACVQVLPQMTSFYVWEGEMHRDPEHLVLIKTLAEKYDELEAFIRQNHSYDVPEIIAIEADKVSRAYFEWISAAVTRPR